MRGRWRFVSATGAILVAACASGGSDTDTDASLLESPDSTSSGSDGPVHHQDGPDSFPDVTSPKDSGTAPPEDSTVPPEDTSTPDALPFDVIPFDVTVPADASADAFTDAGGGAVNCPLTFKYILEAEIASESEDPPLCSDGCTAKQCCFKPAGICLKK